MRVSIKIVYLVYKLKKKMFYNFHQITLCRCNVNFNNSNSPITLFPSRYISFYSSLILHRLFYDLYCSENFTLNIQASQVFFTFIFSIKVGQFLKDKIIVAMKHSTKEIQKEEHVISRTFHLEAVQFCFVYCAREWFVLLKGGKLHKSLQI